MPHLDPDRLSAIALGDVVTDAEQAHLDACDACALELAELEYTVTVTRSTVGVGELESPPERVWERISDEVRAVPDAEPTRAAGPRHPESAVPDASAAEARSRRRLRVLVALAASLALIIGAFGTWTFVQSATRAVPVASATLDAFPDHPDASGEARVLAKADGEQVVEVSLADSEPDDGYREVWLITADASALVSLGTLQGSRGEFPVPAGIDLRDYVLVDISQEPDDGDPAHSGDSIVRGELSFA